MASKGPEPRLIDGGLHVDARGVVTHVNDFDFMGVDRFYTIRSHRPFEPRGWVAEPGSRRRRAGRSWPLARRSRGPRPPVAAPGSCAAPS